MHDMVIASCTGYRWEQIQYWVNSLDRSGFTGYKVVLAYNMDAATAAALVSRGYLLVTFEKDTQGNLSYPFKDFAIVVDRFIHIWQFLRTFSQPLRYVIATDIRDVIFQTNPSNYIDKKQDYKFIASSEAIAYKDEPWGANNLKLSFGEIMYDAHKEHTIYNCGVLAGEYHTFMGLCETLWLTCRGTIQHVPGGGGPDQAALNLLLSTHVYRNCGHFANHEDPWAAQCGTTLDPNKIDAYKPFLRERQPVLGEYVQTPNGEHYAIVHQWDRVPVLKASFERIYG